MSNIKYAVIPKEKAPEQLPPAPVVWEFEVNGVEYVGLEWNEGDKVPKLGENWLTFETSQDYEKWKSNY